MRAAPAVDAPLPDGRVARWLIVLLHMAAMAVLLVWAAAWWASGALEVSSAAAPAATPAAGLLMALAAALGHWQARRLLNPRLQRLRWDGRHWHGQSAGQPLALRAVRVQIDLGDWLLLRLHVASSRRAGWALASARAAGPDWHALRVALRHHAGSGSGAERVDPAGDAPVAGGR